MRSSRFYIAIAAAVMVTSGLFLVMRALITADNAPPPPVFAGDPITVTRVDRPEDPRPPTPPVDEDPEVPPDPKLDKRIPLDKPKPIQDGKTPDVRPIDTKDIDGISTLPDSLPVAMVRIAPEYPQTQAARCIEGYVVVEFTVTTDGTTRDIAVVETSNSAFNRNAVRAVQSWRYRPGLKDGQPIEVRLSVRIDFKLEGSC